jgi:hypothetical protein
MSTPLDLAVEIAGTLSRLQAARARFNPRTLAMEMSRRHPGVGYSHGDIAEALAEEGVAAGVRIDDRLA